MQFQMKKTAIEKIGEKIGKILGFIIFSIVIFFIIAKTGKLCWSLKNYAYFAASLAATLFLLDRTSRRLGGSEKNKDIS